MGQYIEHSNNTNNYALLVKIVIDTIYFYLNSEDAKRNSSLFLAKSQQHEVKQYWLLPESGIIKKILSLFFPRIKFHQKIYLPSQVRKPIDLEYIGTCLTYFENENESNFDGSKEEVLNNNSEDYNKNDTLFLKNQSSIQVRILCQEKLERIDSINNHSKQQTQFDTIIIHIHGGGFIANSSQSHQNYTRVWANSVRAPIFSIDYKLAPEYPYPEGLNDCWQAYTWIIENIEKIYSISLKNIILIGDSAGGNLVSGLCTLCIIHKYRIPDTLLLAYPILNLTDNSQFSPSYLNSFSDPLTPFKFLLNCKESYLGNLKDKGLLADKDFILSPLLTPELILQKFPKTRIVLGERDPLRDDGLRFGLKLSKLNIDTRLFYFNEMIHGFLSINFITGLAESNKAIDRVAQIIQELL